MRNLAKRIARFRIGGVGDINRAILSMKSLFLELESYCSSAVFHFFDGDVDGVGREEFFNEFGPFDEAGAGCVEIVVGTNVYGFCEVLDAVEIEVVDGAFKEIAVVLVDDGEGGGVDHVFYAEHFT